MINKITNSLKRRVVVTGMGIVSPLGNSINENWDNVLIGKIGIRDLSKEKFSEMLPKSCKIGATIDHSFDKTKYKTLVISFLIKGTDNLLTQITLCAVEQAMESSKFTVTSKKDTYRTVYIV